SSAGSPSSAGLLCACDFFSLPPPCWRAMARISSIEGFFLSMAREIEGSQRCRADRQANSGGPATSRWSRLSGTRPRAVALDGTPAGGGRRNWRCCLEFDEFLPEALGLSFSVSDTRGLVSPHCPVFSLLREEAR